MRNRSAQGVRSWVVEFKRTRRTEPLISFDNLFKDALSLGGQADIPTGKLRAIKEQA